jgi:hypothetical protein
MEEECGREQDRLTLSQTYMGPGSGSTTAKLCTPGTLVSLSDHQFLLL